jgi:flagellar basal-body rod protein FlgC
MSAERMRVDVAALNLANANTIHTPDGPNYQPLRVVARATPASGLDGSSLSFAGRVDQGLDGEWLLNAALPHFSIEPTAGGPRMVFEPGHPFANEQGFVSHPAVDTATEMVVLMSALRAYEANVAAMSTARTLALKALDIGGGT